ncbi:MAG: putative inner membrane protein [Candidatus Omnitrophica bacterium ADurb.Bin277]|nr:MAG: putative inner membrane protein [Candidatus Omnitrophica bacterium ADurb.Bin277]
MKREHFISIFFLTALIFIIYLVVRIFSPFVSAMFWSAVLAFAIYPAYALIRKKFPGHDTLTAAVMTFLVFVLIIVPFVLIIINVTVQAIEACQWIYDYVRQGKLEALIETARSTSWIQKIETKIIQWDLLKQHVSSWLINLAKNAGSYTASQVGTFTKNIFFFLLNFFFMFFLTFVFFKHGERIYEFVYQVAPFEKETKDAVFQQINDTFTAVIRGQILTSLAQAIVAGITFWALGIPVPLLFASLVFLVSLIPVLGAASIWVPLAIFLAISQSYTQAIILFAVGALGISLLDNIIKPAIIGERTKLSYFLLFFGIMGGLKLFGLMGIFLAPVVLSVFFALTRIYRRQYL